MSDKPKLWPEQHWSIAIDIDGEEVVRIEPGIVTGKGLLSGEEQATACRAVRYMAAFLGCEDLEQKHPML